MLYPRGQSFTITVFLDAFHATDKRSGRLHTGYLIFVNISPIVFYSNLQSTVESSTFSSKFIAMKTCMEHIIALRFKLWRFGVYIDGPAIVLSD